MNLTLLPHLIACAVCLPDQNSDVARAANLMLLFMAVVVVGMLGLVIKIMLNFARREREHLDSLNNEQ